LATQSVFIATRLIQGSQALKLSIFICVIFQRPQKSSRFGKNHTQKNFYSSSTIFLHEVNLKTKFKNEDIQLNLTFFVIASLLSAQPCRFNLIATFHAQEFTSPGYPHGYPSNLNCVWTITSASGQVELQFIDFATEEEIDYVEVRICTSFKKQTRFPYIFVSKRVVVSHEVLFPYLVYVYPFCHVTFGFLKLY